MLLCVPEEEAERFIGWGVHVFHGPHGSRQAADEVRLDRRPNPHVSFGFGPHLCLGAAHARTVMRSLLEAVCRRVATLEVITNRPRIERTAAYDRPLGYESLVVRLRPLPSD